MAGLVDPYGNAISSKRKKLPPGLDLFFQLPQVEALSNWDVALAKATALSHDNGQFTISSRMYYGMLTDPRVSDGLEKRALAGQTVDYDIVPGDGRGAAELCRRMRKRFGLTDKGRTGANRVLPPRTDAELHGMALMLGFAPAQPEWSYEDDGWFYPEVKPWHPQLCYYLPITLRNEVDTAAPGRLYTYAWNSENGQPGAQIPIDPGTGQWMVFSFNGDHKPWLYGKLRSSWRWWISRLQALLLWLRFNDVHGVPIRALKVPMGMRKAPETQKLFKGIQTIGRDSSLYLPQGTDGKFGVNLEIIEAKAESWKSLEAMLNNYGREITIDLTGGTQNAEATGGNYKGAQDQMEIRHEVKGADCSAKQEVLNRQLFVPFAVLNGYGEDAAPMIVYNTAPPRDRKVDADAAAAECLAMQQAATAADLLRKQGVVVNVVDLLEERGIKLPKSTRVGPLPPMPRDPGAQI